MSFILGPSKVKMTVKGSAVVDPDSDLDGSHHVLEEGKKVWNAVLGLVDIVRGSNSYYKLQLLEGDHSKSYTIFRSWGRVGTTIGGNKVEVNTIYHVDKKKPEKKKLARNQQNKNLSTPKFITLNAVTN